VAADRQTRFVGRGGRTIGALRLIEFNIRRGLFEVAQ
jgi:predicted RNA-binding protein YlqC (UPF0109 family)